MEMMLLEPSVYESAVESDAWQPNTCVDEAKWLMLNPHYDVEEIAAFLGFRSMDEFKDEFMASVGEHPAEYRARIFHSRSV